MKYPKLYEGSARSYSRLITDAFRGYNASERIADGQWAYTENVTADKYPVAASRNARKYYKAPSGARGFVLYRTVQVTGTSVHYATVAPYGDTYDRLWINNTPITGENAPAFARSGRRKHMITETNWIYVLPAEAGDTDRPIRYNVSSGSFEYLDAAFSSSAASVRYMPCDESGALIAVTWSDVTPTDPGTNDATYWVDVSGDDPVLKRWSTVLSDWIPSDEVYMRVQATGIGSDFEEGDCVLVTNAQAAPIGEFDDQDQYDFNAGQIASLNSKDDSDYRKIVSKGANYIVFKGFFLAMDVSVAQDSSATMTVRREIPLMDHVIVGENRLWGCACRNNVNEIYASRLGDFKNWRDYDVIATASWTATIGVPGPFTGAVFVGSYPVFFKEDCAIKVYGSAPSQYRTSVTSGRGVKYGSQGSVAVVNESVIYHSVAGVSLYDGSAIYDIGDPLGVVRYSNGTGAADGGKYYLSVKNEQEEWSLFVYDLNLKIWVREDDTCATFGSSWGETAGLYVPSLARVLVPRYSDIPGNNGLLESEGTFPWELQSGEIGFDTPDEKYLSRFNIRVSMAAGASMDVYVQYDSTDTGFADGDRAEWEHKYSMQAPSKRTFTIPIRPRRCDHMRIRITGRGECLIYSIAKFYERGSDEVR